MVAGGLAGLTPLSVKRVAKATGKVSKMDRYLGNLSIEKSITGFNPAVTDAIRKSKNKKFIALAAAGSVIGSTIGAIAVNKRKQEKIREEFK